MAVVELNGSTDEIRLAKGTWAATGALTIAVLAKRMTNATWDCLVAAHTTGNVGTCGFEISDNSGGGGVFLNRLSYFAGATGDAGASATSQVLTTDGWSILAVTKTAGTTLARFHRFPLSSGSWVRENASSITSPNPASSAGGTIRIGTFEGIDPAAIRIALLGVWDAALSDAQVDALSSGLTTSAWTGHAVAPRGVVETTAISGLTDLMGNGANETTRTGTTVVTGDDPPSWVFSGGTVTKAPPPIRRRPRGLIIR